MQELVAVLRHLGRRKLLKASTTERHLFNLCRAALNAAGLALFTKVSPVCHFLKGPCRRKQVLPFLVSCFVLQ